MHRFASTIPYLPRRLLVFLALWGYVPPEIAQGQLPNIVVILADDMGYGDVQALNPESKIPTPHLDQLAADGMAFLDSHSPSAVCTPTRYGLLTGRYCWRTRLKSGVLGGYSPPLIEQDRVTLPEMLRSRGYATSAVGKWHLGMDMAKREPDADLRGWEGDPGIDFRGIIRSSPVHQGFDYYFGHSASLDMPPYVYIRNDRFTKIPTEQQPRGTGTAFVRAGPRADDFRVEDVLDRLTEEATACIRRMANGDQPFFLYMPLTAPHKPVVPHSRFRGKTELNTYGDFIHQVDSTVGQVLRSLEDADIAENTLVIFTSDNGSFMGLTVEAEAETHADDAEIARFYPDAHRPNGPFRGTKADIWEAGHHVPFFVRWPGHIAAGSRTTATICHVDVFATCAEIVGFPLDGTLAEDSCSLLPFFRGGFREAVQRPAPVIHHSSRGMFAIREGKWKLIAGNGSGGREPPRGQPFAQPYQLYDLHADIAETTDVAGQHPKVVGRLTARLDEIRQSGRSSAR